MIGLACSTLSCDGFVDSHFDRTFEVAPQVGFKYIEFNCWFPSDLTPQGIRRARQRCQAAGLLPAAVYGSAFGAASTFDLGKDVGHKLRMIEAAVELGCRRIVATGAGRGQAGGLDEIVTVLEQITPVAEENGILICLENHANNNLETIEDYRRIFAAVPSPNVGLCIDTGHFSGSGISLDDVVACLGDRVNHIHVKEAAAMGLPKFVPFGQGVTDNNRLIEQMIARGYSGFVSVELAIEDKTNLVHDLKASYALFGHYETPDDQA
jgi:sugar phosphate isomerase/epimerase